MAEEFELILRGGRVLDPSQDLDTVADVAFSGRRVASIGPDLAASGDAEIIDASGFIVTPGLIDLHAHVYYGGTSLSLAPDPIAAESAQTTIVDAGSAGAGNFHGFREFVIEPSHVNILAYLNISFAGIFGFADPIRVGENQDLRLVNVEECVRVARENLDVVVGVKARVGPSSSGANHVIPVDLAIQAAEELGLPVMIHVEPPPPSHRQILSRLRKGDVLTHFSRAFPNRITEPSGRVIDECLAARERGVIFDVGHGRGSFSFSTFRGLLAEDFLPDVISSDVHVGNVHGPVHNQLVTMNKFLALGMDLPSIIRATTVRPAEALRRPEIGTLKPGSTGDASVIRILPNPIELQDSYGEKMTAEETLDAIGTVRAGRWRPANHYSAGAKQ